MTISKTVCVAILFLFLAGPSWAQDKTKKNPPNKPGVQNPTGKKRPPGADAKQDDKPTGDKAGRANAMAGMLEKLDLTDDQSAEIRAIMKEQASERRARMENQKGNNQGQPGNNQGSAEFKEKRDAVISKFQSQGLKGKELKQAVQQSLGKQDRPQPGNRPKDQMVQVQAEMIKKIREVLTEEQQAQLDELLRKRAENQKADRQPAKPGTDKAKRPGNPPGKGGR